MPLILLLLKLSILKLEDQDIIKRVVYPQVPPKVEYSLTEYGKTLEPVNEWGVNHLKHLEEVKD
ncbi:winged helix-turn-helix transcriptional regulator [Peribacillus sp. NPDC097198]|uniref:winged helix-turn-helix transcriptional regulator n=1 Tax=Peribacillus sp. NPDC097198 TaxID=3364397 RepID=UPI0038215669